MEKASQERKIVFAKFWKRKGILRNIIIFFLVIGPAIITSSVGNDAGGIATYSLAGANFGYTMIWSLLPITIALIIVQVMCARMGIVTGKGLAGLIRENYGVKITFFVMLVLLFGNFTNILSEFSGIAASAEIFGVNKYISLPLSALFVWLLVVKGTYKSVEKVFLIGCIFYATYIVSGFLANPDWNEVVADSVVKPKVVFEHNYTVMLLGIIGTTIAPWMLFYLQASIVDKGVKIEEYKHSRLEVIIGSIVVSIIIFFIIVACAATIHKTGMKIETVADAANALRPLAGIYCSALFAFGLLNASLLAASVLPLATAYSICEGFGWETGVDKKFKEAPYFFGLYTALIILGAGIVLIPNFPLLKVMYFSQVNNGILLPFALIFMLLISNRRDLMGQYVNSKTFNIIVWIFVLIMIILSIFMLVTLF